MSIVDKILIRLTADIIGEDEYGHTYYIARKDSDYLNRKKRFIVYNGIAEPSKIPPMWHAWLHHLSDVIPLKGKIKNFKWQKDHMPNLTGTIFAYSPMVHSSVASTTVGDNNVSRKKVSSDYEAWSPK